MRLLHTPSEATRNSTELARCVGSTGARLARRDERDDVGVPLQVAQDSVLAHVVHGAPHQAPQRQRRPVYCGAPLGGLAHGPEAMSKYKCSLGIKSKTPSLSHL